MRELIVKPGICLAIDAGYPIADALWGRVMPCRVVVLAGHGACSTHADPICGTRSISCREIVMTIASKPKSRRATTSNAPATMRAAAIDRFGGPEVLKLHTVPVPEVERG